MSDDDAPARIVARFAPLGHDPAGPGTYDIVGRNGQLLGWITRRPRVDATYTWASDEAYCWAVAPAGGGDVHVVRYRHQAEELARLFFRAAPASQ